jgi:hypothetical protein
MAIIRPELFETDHVKTTLGHDQRERDALHHARTCVDLRTGE